MNVCSERCEERMCRQVNGVRAGDVDISVRQTTRKQEEKLKRTCRETTFCFDQAEAYRRFRAKTPPEIRSFCNCSCIDDSVTVQKRYSVTAAATPATVTLATAPRATAKVVTMVTAAAMVTIVTMVMAPTRVGEGVAHGEGAQRARDVRGCRSGPSAVGTFSIETGVCWMYVSK